VDGSTHTPTPPLGQHSSPVPQQYGATVQRGMKAGARGGAHVKKSPLVYINKHILTNHTL
jgi:hypothetical protein